MGTYYYLVNDTKKQTVHLDYHIKHGPLTLNRAVHYAFANYLMHNQGDCCRLMGDYTDIPDYKEIDLLNYAFKNKSIIENIVKMLNDIYEYKKYIVRNGVGVKL